LAGIGAEMAAFPICVDGSPEVGERQRQRLPACRVDQGATRGLGKADRR
jgi:hypothetical protein